MMVMLQSFIQYLLYLVEKVGNNLKYAVLKGQSHEIKVRFFGAQRIEKSTGQMKFRWETLTSKLVIKTLI